MSQIRMLFQLQITQKWLIQDQHKTHRGSMFEFYDHLLIKLHLFIIIIFNNI
jgi:hypothetical protein